MALNLSTHSQESLYHMVHAAPSPRADNQLTQPAVKVMAGTQVGRPGCGAPWGPPAAARNAPVCFLCPSGVAKGTQQLTSLGPKVSTLGSFDTTLHISGWQCFKGGGDRVTSSRLEKHFFRTGFVSSWGTPFQ